MPDARAEAMRAAGRRIAQLRQLQDLTQSALAERCYVGQSAVSQWERGKKVPSINTQFRVADVLHVTRSGLFRELIELDERVA